MVCEFDIVVSNDSFRSRLRQLERTVQLNDLEALKAIQKAIPSFAWFPHFDRLIATADEHPL